ncbi:hypothetical protein FRC12_009740 [Ceratobasidium sp. 428]|nr:hypothetical protein FRC12_009740 [Ceratobasidium sp. 428]
MSPWTVSAIFANVSFIWGHNPRPSDDLKGVDVNGLLKEIDDILRHTNKLLKSHKYLLPDDQYADFIAQHRTFRWEFTDQQRRLDDSSDPAAREESQDHATRLLDTLKIYRTSLLEASRQATFGSAPAFPDEEPEPADCQTFAGEQATPAPGQPIASPALDTPVRPRTPARLPSFRPPSPPRISKISIQPTNVGLLGKLRTANAFLAPTSAPAPEPDFIEGQGFAIAVVHVPRDSAENLYQRLVYVKMGDRQLQIPGIPLVALKGD